MPVLQLAKTFSASPNTNKANNPIPVSVVSSPNTNKANNPLAVSIAVAKDPITVGDVQTITVTVTDANSNESINNADVKGTVTYASDATTIQFAGTTDNSGEVSHSWTMGDANPGVFTVTVEASASDHKTGYKMATFEVNSLHVNDTSSKDNNHNNNSNNNHHHSNHH